MSSENVRAPLTDAPIAAELRDSITDARKRFVMSVAGLRPKLHRFCTRMVGSSLDGEDLVQEALTDAFYNLGSLRDPARFESWLFRIAYFKCIDFVRRSASAPREADVELEHIASADDSSDDLLPDAPIDDALLMLVGKLPPKERAAVVLKEVLDYSLREIAEIIDSTLGGVKAALHRARTKLDAGQAPPAVATLDDARRKLFEAYADCFNRRDWEALKSLVRADARLEIVGERIDAMSDLGVTYSTNYAALPWEWRLAVGEVDGELAVVHWKLIDGAWEPHAAIRLVARNGKVEHIRDYVHVGYVLQDASIASADDPLLSIY